MTPQRFRQIRQVFEAVLARPAADRASALDQQCAGDLELHREVEQLLAEHEQTQELLDQPAVAWFNGAAPEVPLPELLGTTVGPYQIRRVLGHGGMGIVYLAERQVGRVCQKVALKVVRAEGQNQVELGRRFEQEREILASFDHPDIARLLDVGTTPEGRPYLVMEYVEGEPINAYCDRRTLSVADRVRLFQTVCAAVEYAHQRGVIHRDLKPGNILVSAQGVVKLLDFGIAKLTGVELPRETLTRTGLNPMTVEYASPEQLRGEPVTTTTDVYSLGVILYELLTGHRPYRLGRHLAHEAVRVICEQPPVQASVMVMESEEVLTPDGSTDTVTPEAVARLRGDRPAWLKLQLSGDLDSILVKSLRKEAMWRYASPAQLGQDLDRHLRGQPVSAHQGSWRYSLSKLMRQALYPNRGQLHTSAFLFFAWGMFGAYVLEEKQAVLSGWKHKSTLAPLVMFLLLFNAVMASMREGRRLLREGQLTVMDRQASIVFGVTLGTLGLLSFVSALPRAIPEPALCLFCNAGLGMALLILGLQAERVLTFGGMALLVSVVVASLQPDQLYGVLGAGMVLGYIGPALVFSIRSDTWRDMTGGLRWLAVLTCVAVPILSLWSIYEARREPYYRQHIQRGRPLIRVLYGVGDTSLAGETPRLPEAPARIHIHLKNFGAVADQVVLHDQGRAATLSTAFGESVRTHVASDEDFTLVIVSKSPSRITGSLTYTSQSLQMTFTEPICLEKSPVPLVDSKSRETRDWYVAACKSE